MPRVAGPSGAGAVVLGGGRWVLDSAVDRRTLLRGASGAALTALVAAACGPAAGGVRGRPNAVWSRAGRDRRGRCADGRLRRTDQRACGHQCARPDDGHPGGCSADPCLGDRGRLGAGRRDGVRLQRRLEGRDADRCRGPRRRARRGRSARRCAGCRTSRPTGTVSWSGRTTSPTTSCKRSASTRATLP